MAKYADPTDIGLDDLLLDIVSGRILGHERSQQSRIGPSGLGTPCLRKLGFRLAEIEPVKAEVGLDAPWRPTVGTAVHTWLASMLEAANTTEMASGLHSSHGRCKAPWCKGGKQHTPRFLVEYRTVTGTLPLFGPTVVQIDGTVDVFDRLTGTVVDWKICGPGRLTEYRATTNRDEAPSEEYRVQGQTYGRGLAHEGFDVRHVAILFLPMNGELRDAVWWTEPYDPEVGKDAFNRARRLLGKFETDGGPEEVLPRLTRTFDMCGHCPWFSPGAEGEELAYSCPGAPQMSAASASDAMADLLGSDPD